jgi:ADP-ribose pyrophosphatase YjhB (NUDIX family)
MAFLMLRFRCLLIKFKHLAIERRLGQTMVTSKLQTEQFNSEAFVESAGAVLFRLSDRHICALQLLPRKEYVLAKGRRNCGETRQKAALREIQEETGYKCRLLPVTMLTRAPPVIESEQSDNVARTYVNITEPVTLQIRHLADGSAKLIWWYIAAVCEDTPAKEDRPGEKSEVGFYSYEEVLKKLTFQQDRDLVRRAIEIVRATCD